MKEFGKMSDDDLVLAYEILDDGARSDALNMALGIDKKPKSENAIQREMVAGEIRKRGYYWSGIAWLKGKG